MIRRESDPELVNRISNEPSVKAALGGRYAFDDAIDWSPAFPATRSGAVVLTNGEDAAQIYEMKGERAWEVCSIFAPTCRGERAREVGGAMRDWMRPYADMIFGSVPDSFPHAKRFYEDLGGVATDAVDVDGETYRANDGDTLYVLRFS